MNSIKVVKIILEARAGAELESTLKEAILIAATEWKDVEISHNDKIFYISTNSLRKACRLVSEIEEKYLIKGDQNGSEKKLD
jgi:CRISPR/Cas system-associated protein Csm6